jgi:hypothetical protein
MRYMQFHVSAACAQYSCFIPYPALVYPYTNSSSLPFSYPRLHTPTRVLAYAFFQWFITHPHIHPLAHKLTYQLIISLISPTYLSTHAVAHSPAHSQSHTPLIHSLTLSLAYKTTHAVYTQTHQITSPANSYPFLNIHVAGNLLYEYSLLFSSTASSYSHTDVKQRLLVVQVEYEWIFKRSSK